MKPDRSCRRTAVGTTVREKLWLWGHDVGAHNQGWGLPQPSRIMPAEAAAYPAGPIVRGGITDRLLSDYPNLYGDLSANSGNNMLSRDDAFTREFLRRHQDKLMFGSDCGCADGHGAGISQGNNPAAARLAGIPVGPRVLLAFVLSGGIAGVAGAVWLSYYGSVDAIAGVGYEFQVITAVVVGGVAIFGGSGTVLGAALGALLLNTIDSALVVINVSSNWNQALAGGLLVGAIAFDRLVAVRVAPALRTGTRRRAIRG